LQEEKLAGRAAEIGAYFLDALQSLKSHKYVGEDLTADAVMCL